MRFIFECRMMDSSGASDWESFKGQAHHRNGPCSTEQADEHIASEFIGPRVQRVALRTRKSLAFYGLFAFQEQQ